MAEALKRPVWDEDITHGAPLSTALQELIAHYNQTAAYTPKTADQIRSQAEGENKTYFDQQRLSAQQAYDRNNLALQQQLAGIGRSYDKAREASAREYGNAYSQADRALLGRGMQRSSYGMQSLGNLAQRGLEAQQDIWDQQVQAEGNITAQQTQIAQQLADQLRQYDQSQADAVLARIRELEDQEYQRGVANQNTRNQLSTQIYEYLRENNAAGSSRGGSYTPATTPANDDKGGDDTPAAGDTPDDGFNGFLAALGGLDRATTTPAALSLDRYKTQSPLDGITPKTVVLSGPVDTKNLDILNGYSDKTGVRYESELRNHITANPFNPISTYEKKKLTKKTGSPVDTSAKKRLMNIK